MSKKISTAAAAALLLAGCASSTYYLSPYQATTGAYHAQPLLADSLRSSWYASGTFSFGAANQMHDDVFAFHASVHHTHQFGQWQAYYGAQFTAGNYGVSFNDGYSTYWSPDTAVLSYLNKGAGDKFFGGFGIFGGLNYVVGLNEYGAEWRVLGIEASAQQEFGQYYSFRRNLADTMASSLMRSPFYPTAGITTEIIFQKSWRGPTVGIKLALGLALQPTVNFQYANGNHVFNNFYPSYFSATFHVDRGRLSFFGQVTGTSYAIIGQTGVSFRLSAKKKKN